MPRVRRDRFDVLVEEALENLPGWVIEEMDNVRVFVEDEPPKDQPTLLGLYHGVPLDQRGGHYSGVLPDTVTLYRSTIERAAGDDEDDLYDTIFHTLAHELAHHFGIDDARLLDIDAY
jgi:predicted Zn-dependent protease with MMP-like domain